MSARVSSLPNPSAVSRSGSPGPMALCIMRISKSVVSDGADSVSRAAESASVIEPPRSHESA